MRRADALLAIRGSDGGTTAVAGDVLAVAGPGYAIARDATLRFGANCAAITLNRRRPGEPIAFVFADQILVGQPLLVQLRAFFVKVCLSTLLGGLLLGDPSLLLGQLRSLLAFLGGLVMFVDDLIAALIELSFP